MKLHEHMEELHIEMEPFHEEMELLGDRMEKALQGEVIAVLQAELRPSSPLGRRSMRPRP